MDSESGSIIAIIATDAPVSSLSLRQIAKRAAIGVGRGGSPGGNNSGDIFLSMFSYLYLNSKFCKLQKLILMINYLSSFD